MKKLDALIKYMRLSFNNGLIRLMPKRKFEQKKYYLSLCSIFKNEAKYMEEWLNFHLIVGFEHFYIYNNFSSDNYKEVLAPYIEKGIVTLIEWPYEHAQMEAYNDCVKQFSSESNWIAFMDLDEFAVPLSTNDVKKHLKKYEKFPCVLGFYRNFSSNGRLKDDDTLPVIEQFVTCSKFISPSMFLNTAWIKAIKSFKLSHYCRFKFFNKVCPVDAAFMSGLTHQPKAKDFQFNHYHNKSLDYFITKKIPRGDVFSAKYHYDLGKFFEKEASCGDVDYNAYRYLIKLKTFDLKNYQPK